MSEVKKVNKKKKKRKLAPFVKFVCYIMILFSCYLLFLVVQEIYTTVELRKELADAQTRYQEVKDENSYLSSEKEKLQDPDYVQSYARGNYMLSKDGEQIFYLPEKDDDQ